MRNETKNIDYLSYGGYREKFERVPSILIEEWESIKQEVKDEYGEYANLLKRLKGFLYEALFYYACLDMQCTFLDAELIEFGGSEPYFPEYPPWFEAIPLYDIIPTLHNIQEKRIRKRRVPQVEADFLVCYVDDKGPSPPALVDVKSNEPRGYREKWGWQIVAAMRMGFIFQLAYPKHGIEYPTSLKEWELRTPCPKCKKLSRDYRECSECRAKIFPFTIVDARYTLKELVKQLGMSYKGRF